MNIWPQLCLIPNSPHSRSYPMHTRIFFIHIVLDLHLAHISTWFYLTIPGNWVMYYITIFHIVELFSGSTKSWKINPFVWYLGIWNGIVFYHSHRLSWAMLNVQGTNHCVFLNLKLFDYLFHSMYVVSLLFLDFLKKSCLF